MSDNAEEGIARVQAAATRAGGSEALGRHQARSIAYLGERILMFLVLLGGIGLLVLWATAESALLLYGSFAALILLLILWGYARIKRIERERTERVRVAREWKSDSGG